MKGLDFDVATDFHALCRAARRAARGKRLSREAALFLLDLEPQVLQLQRELRGGTYRPRGYHTFMVHDPKPRMISAAPFRDRVVHHALCAALEPILEEHAIEDSYACRPGKGTLAAIRRAQVLARRSAYVLKLDVERFFESVAHGVLDARLREVVGDERLLEVAWQIIDAGAPGSPPGTGLPIGNLTSQHFANFYLGGLDHFVTGELGHRGYCRYMDDELIFSDAKRELWDAHRAVQGYLWNALRLRLKAEVTRLLPVSDGIPFLGFRIWPSLIRFDPRCARRFRRKFRTLQRALDNECIAEEDAVRSAQSLLGWARHGDTFRFRQSFFSRNG